MLWKECVDKFDGYIYDSFKLYVMLFDFPTYSKLNDYNTKGHKVCPTCEEDTCYRQ